MRGRLTVGLLVAAAGTLAAIPAVAQIPADDYLRFMPIGYPHLVRQTAASERFSLFGDRTDAAYLDTAPVDGVDDQRADWLQQLSLRFAPFMVRNTPLYPIDFRTFYERRDFALHVDTWNLARHHASPLDNTSIPLAPLTAEPCTPGAPPTRADCRLLELLKAYGPGRGTLEPESSSGAERAVYTVMYMDFPGYDETSWKEEYWPSDGTRSRALAGAARTFVHPFITEVAADGGERFELVLQYWFFYPENDGPNNHEGDWEHINVIVSPLSRIERPLDATEIAALVAGSTPLDGDDPLVIRRIEYYLHHYVFPVDFGSPNAYAPHAIWDAQVREAIDDQRGSHWLWEQIRRRAWADEAETRINTRPVVWIGGDAVGIQSVLQKPGLRDRDGHASYPFRGYYKQIGPGVAERVTRTFDLRATLADPATRPEYVEDYGVPARIALVPDWERLSDLLLTHPEVRRDWAWLVLPQRFGFPATPSPGAGTVSHADLGNVSVVGPAFNGGWNRIGDASGYDHYDGVKVSWAKPMGYIDSFFPRIGWFNAPIMYLMAKPPLDLAWRGLALPVRAVVGTRLPTFVRSNAPIERVVSFEIGTTIMPLSDDLAGLFTNRDQLLELAARVAIALPEDAQNLRAKSRFPAVVAPTYSLTFHLSPRFSAESSFASYSADVGFDFSADGVAPIPVRTRYTQIEYHGNTRFNLLTGSVRPYVKFGGGFTTYKLRDMTVNGERMIAADSPRFTPKGSWRRLGFNESIYGGGVEIDGMRMKRAMLGFKASYSAVHHDLGFERDAAVELSTSLAQELAGQIASIWQHEFRLFGSLSF